MPGLEMVPLETQDADAFWRAYVAGRADLPTSNVIAHLERYLSLPPEEQRRYYSFQEGGNIVGTVRLGPTDLTEAEHAVTFFSLLPEARGWARDAILAATEPLIAAGATTVHAGYDDSYSEAFAKLGFEEWFSRIRMEAALTKAEPPDLPVAHPEATDVDDIAAFLMAAYEGHMEQQYGMHVGSAEEWRDYTTAIWKGGSGTYLPRASWLTRVEEGIAGVSLATKWMGTPLLAELVVRKDQRGRGFARALLTATTNALLELGHERLALYVTLGNDPAIKLYEALSFRQVGARTVNAVLEM